jgi:predicted helicase
MNSMDRYLADVGRAIRAGNSTEHTHRPALKSLLESIKAGIVATNEPKRVACGAPDFIIVHGHTPLGYVEAKDVGVPLTRVEATAQLERYRESLRNLILTDYLEFRWYVSGQPRLTARLATVGRKGLVAEPNGAESVAALLSQFIAQKVPIITQPKELAERMAALARLGKDIIQQAFAKEEEEDPLHHQLEGFRKALLYDLTADEFADMYAQTIAYGLFAARVNAPKSTFSREHAGFDLPKTNPFLRKMFAHVAGPDLDPRIEWIADDLVELLRRADMGSVLKDFGHRTKQEDPVVHFYETFLAAYDPEMRESRGVYYTPEPVVSYIIRSVDHVLRTTFKLGDGLADASKVRIPNPQLKAKAKTVEVHRVQILDPATGTGTFLHGAIDHIHSHLLSRRRLGGWSAYVAGNLLPRLFGFELLMAPYAVAHMKLGLQLKELGYDFGGSGRLGVYLTNTLEGAHPMTGLPLFAQWIAEEANAANAIKRDAPVMVVLGNPPYSGHSKNTGEWITELIEDYKKIDGKKIRLGQAKWLQNDYVKFIRFAQDRILKTGYGVLAMITDHSYVDSGTFVGMRANLQASFDELYVLDLQGNAKRNRNRDDIDKNVFDITQGVAILIAVKRETGRQKPGGVYTTQVRGSRQSKYEFLANSSIEDVEWESGSCRAPYYLFVSPTASHLKEYDRLPSVTDLFPGSYGGTRSKRIGTGFVTTHDSFAISMTPAEIASKIETFLATETEKQARRHFELCGQEQWNYHRAKTALASGEWAGEVREVTYRPFDTRFTVWNPNVCVHRRLEVHKHLIDDNVALCVGQAGNVVGSEEWNLAFVASRPVDFNAFYRGGCAVLPLYLYKEADGPQITMGALGAPLGKREPNLSSKLVRDWAERLALSYAEEPGSPKSMAPMDVLNYVYAILYSPAYRERYAGMLDIDFPRVPLTSDPKLFHSLVDLGGRISDLHLKTRELEPSGTYPVSGSNVVTAVSFVESSQGEGKVYINSAQYFGRVPTTVWTYEIGGYRMAYKWLKDRKDRELSYDELVYYQRMISALSGTIALAGKIDQAINEHGGWPVK